MALRKSDKANIRNRYPIYIEVGLILALVILLVAFKANFETGESMEIVQQEQEIVQMEEIQQTEQVQKPPPPPKPPVPVEVPDDEVLDEEELQLDASLNIDESPTNLPPPPPEEEEEAEPEVFMIVEDMPEMQPNQTEGMRQLGQCIEYPEIAKKAGVEGRVFVQFVVDEQGNVQTPTVTRGLGAGTDQEALRCVQTLTFTPGRQRGKPVKVKMSLPVTFRLR